MKDVTTCRLPGCTDMVAPTWPFCSPDHAEQAADRLDAVRDAVDHGLVDLLDGGTVGCYGPECGEDADILTVPLNPELAGDTSQPMGLCTRHFWDWIAESLERRIPEHPPEDLGCHGPNWVYVDWLNDSAERIRELVAVGILDHPRRTG